MNVFRFNGTAWVSDGLIPVDAVAAVRKREVRLMLGAPIIALIVSVMTVTGAVTMGGFVPTLVYYLVSLLLLSPGIWWVYALIESDFELRHAEARLAHSVTPAI